MADDAELDWCRVYWGTHGCSLEPGHDGGCDCCCICESHPDEESGCVGAAPYYGPETNFYGEGAEARKDALADAIRAALAPVPVHPEVPGEPQ